MLDRLLDFTHLLICTQVVELRDSEGHLTRKLIERLFTSLGRANAKGTAMVDSADSIMSCWRIVQTYRLNAQRTLRVGRGTQLAIFYTSVLVTCASPHPERTWQEPCPSLATNASVRAPGRPWT